MSTWAVVLLGAVALGSLIQSVFLIWLALSGLKLARRVAEIQGDIQREIQPALRDLERVQQNLGDASARMAQQTERIEVLVEEMKARLDEARIAVMPVAGRVVTLIALVKSVRRGWRMLRDLRSGSPIE